MGNAVSVFRLMDNALLDLQQSTIQNFDLPLKKLAKVLRSEALAKINSHLTEGLDLEAFLKESDATGGSMMGSHRLVWPDDAQKALGLTILLIEKLADDPQYAIQFSLIHFLHQRQDNG